MSVDIGDGASCHVGYKSCFYRSIPLGKLTIQKIEMKFKENKKIFNPDIIMYKTKSYKGLNMLEEKDFNKVCEECENISVMENLVMHGYKI